MENIIKLRLLFTVLFITALTSCVPEIPSFSVDDYLGEFDTFELNEQTSSLLEEDMICYIQTKEGHIIQRDVLHKKGKDRSKLKLNGGLKNGEYRLLYFEYKVSGPDKDKGGFSVRNFGLGMRILVEKDGYRIMDEYNPNYGLSGKGTEEEPFIITSASHLDTLRKITNTLPTEGVYFSQMTHIQGSDMLYHGYLCDPDHYWTPIGYDMNRPFRGIYDGNGYYIQGVKSISSNKTIGRGLFGFACGAVFNDVTIKDSYIVGTYGAGTLLGIVISDAGELDATQIYNCKVISSEVYGLDGCLSLGGLVGAVDSKAVLNIASSSSEGSKIEGDYNVGGLIGAGALQSTITVSDCHNSSTVKVHHSGAGGIIANCDTINISVSTNKAEGVVTGPTTKGDGDAAYIAYGGIVGGSRCATINVCENFAPVTGYEGVGGIIGSTRVKYDDNGYLFNNVLLKYCKNGGAIKGANNVGGLCGEAQFGAYASLNTGTVSGNDYVGGIAGYTSMAVIENTVNNNTVKGDSYVAGIVGKASTGLIAVSQNFGAIEASGSHAAGVAGYCEDYMMIHYCSNYAGIKGGSTPIAGIVAEIGKEQELSTLNKVEIAFGAAQIFVGAVLGPVLGIVEKVTEKVGFLVVEVVADILVSLVETGFLGHALHEVLHHEVEEISSNIKALAQKDIEELSAELETIRSSASVQLQSSLSASPINVDYSNAVVSLAKDINNEENNKLFTQNISDDLDERLHEVMELNEESERNYLIAGSILLAFDVVAIIGTIATAGTSVAIIPACLGITASFLGGLNSITKGVNDFADNVVVVSQCANMGNITGGSGDRIGGIVGTLQQRGAVKNCLNTASGPGSDRGGQIIGYAEWDYTLESSLALGDNTWEDIIGQEPDSSPSYPLDGVYYYKSGSISYNAGTKRDNSTLPDLSKYSGWDQNYWRVPVLDENDKKLSYPVPYKSEMLY